MRFLFCLTALLLLSNPVQAASLSEVLSVAEELNLSRDPVWLKLLHYEREGDQSEVLTDSFFLSSNGRSDPHSELRATIKAYFDPWSEDADEDPRCRFPARYYWLSNHISLPEYDLREPKCQRLEKWALFDSVQSVSLLLVSGYFGNPASTFGHALLKLNADSADDRYGLFDLTLNYGALVPENESTFRYVARGLSGGYEAGFSDKYFYTQDLVYSRTELRDIWDYRLSLSDYQRKLLILHIWEIVGKKFTYYFLDKNCAYRLAELLELVIKEELLNNASVWYVPVELFHGLNDIDEAMYRSDGSKLISSVRFIPSRQRMLYHQLKQLHPDEVRAVNDIVQSSGNTMSAKMTDFMPGRQIKILDALLAYQKYKLIAEEPDPDPERRKAKDRILLARLRLPASSEEPAHPSELPSPADGSRPTAFGVSVGGESDGTASFRLHWAPFKQELLGQKNFEGDELVLFDVSVGVSEKDGVFVDQVDLIRVRNLNTTSVSMVDESLWSWQMHVGAGRIKEDERELYDGTAGFGAGYAWRLTPSLTGYGMIDIAGHTRSPLVRLRPNAGAVIYKNKLRAWLYFGAESAGYDMEFKGVWGGQIQYQFSDRSSIRLEISNEKATRTSAGLNLYW